MNIKINQKDESNNIFKNKNKFNSLIQQIFISNKIKPNIVLYYITSIIINKSIYAIVKNKYIYKLSELKNKDIILIDYNEEDNIYNSIKYKNITKENLNKLDINKIDEINNIIDEIKDTNNKVNSFYEALYYTLKDNNIYIDDKNIIDEIDNIKNNEGLNNNDLGLAFKLFIQYTFYNIEMKNLIELLKELSDKYIYSLKDIDENISEKKIYRVLGEPNNPLYAYMTDFNKNEINEYKNEDGTEITRIEIIDKLNILMKYRILYNIKHNTKHKFNYEIITNLMNELDDEILKKKYIENVNKYYIVMDKLIINTYKVNNNMQEIIKNYNEKKYILENSENIKNDISLNKHLIKNYNNQIIDYDKNIKKITDEYNELLNKNIFRELFIDIYNNVTKKTNTINITPLLKDSIIYLLNNYGNYIDFKINFFDKGSKNQMKYLYNKISYDVYYIDINNKKNFIPYLDYNFEKIFNSYGKIIDNNLNDIIRYIDDLKPIILLNNYDQDTLNSLYINLNNNYYIIKYNKPRDVELYNYNNNTAIRGNILINNNINNINSYIYIKEGNMYRELEYKDNNENIKMIYDPINKYYLYKTDL